MKALITIAALTLSCSAFADAHGHKAGKAGHDAKAMPTATTTTTTTTATPDAAKVKAATDACKAEKAKDMKACVDGKVQTM